MIRELRIGNFKAFGPTQTIPIRPLTLIYGPNSAGKSSIIHALALAHEARRRKGDWNVSRTKVGGRSIDLGGFRQYVHGHDIERCVEWALTLDPRDVVRELEEQYKRWETRLQKDGVFTESRQRLAKFSEDARSRIELVLRVGTNARRVGHTNAMPPELVEYEVRADGRTLVGIARDRSGARLEITETHHHDGLLPDGDASIVGRAVDATTWLPKHLELSPGDWSDTGALLKALACVATEQIRRLVYLGPLRSYPPRHVAISDDRDSNWNAGGAAAWEVLRTDEKVREAVNEWLSHERLNTPYRLKTYDLLSWAGTPLGRALREGLSTDLAQWRTEKRREAKALDEDADALRAEVRRLSSAMDPDERLSRSEANVGEEHPSPRTGQQDSHGASEDERDRVKVLLETIRKAATEIIPTLTLFDIQRQVAVSHRDVGIGISQVLPVLVNAFGSKEKLIAIEQPEIHLHPALQAELGDVFIESALGERKNTFIIETHSEHLLLRIMRRMRETSCGTLPGGCPGLSPDHVAVLYVQPTKEGHSVVQEMPLNERGELVRAWPGGFFEEGVREVLGDAR
jgi:AAA ATPase domain/AAA domain